MRLVTLLVMAAVAAALAGLELRPVFRSAVVLQLLSLLVAAARAGLPQPAAQTLFLAQLHQQAAVEPGQTHQTLHLAGQVAVERHQGVEFTVQAQQARLVKEMLAETLVLQVLRMAVVAAAVRAALAGLVFPNQQRQVTAVTELLRVFRGLLSLMLAAVEAVLFLVPLVLVDRAAAVLALLGQVMVFPVQQIRAVAAAVLLAVRPATVAPALSSSAIRTPLTQR